ncbi:DNA-directed RNA polymerase subunit beta [Paludibaculum fermentans]|uniref:DNA-directed RNA polymerase subunit beta n=1 Tax=Paludibaculum fermentans TaxID=1473598 RepID=A0A7S7NVD7_PALFE|nr:DNA-directed RNA polymerase subunit beta [Paludibaculum fermentans]QOY90450.1 DNA-directed RNA polymerase subunit beta [Paludibaculum fermentans]
MATASNGTPRERVDFSKIRTSVPIPNLIEVQKRSYERFLQMDLLPDERDDIGLQSVFKSVFPITDFRGLSELEFVDYSIGNWECKCGSLKGLNHLRTVCRNPTCGATIKTDPFHPGDVLCDKCGTFNKNIVTFCNRCGDPVGLQLKYDQAECEERGMTYAAPLKVTIRLKMFDKDESGRKTVREFKEQEVFFGEIPLMTPNGTFIINGTERVIVSQLHRSPGVFFEKIQAQSYFLGKIIPYRGSWVEFEFDSKNLLYVRIDRKRKFYGSVFLRALGIKSDSEIIKSFYKHSELQLKDKKVYWKVDESLIGVKLGNALVSKSGETIHPPNRKIREATIEALRKAKVEAVEVTIAEIEGSWVASDVIDMDTGEVLAEANQELTATSLAKIMDAGIKSMDVFFAERDEVGNVISVTLKKDPVKSQNEALLEIYRKLRPGDPPTLDTATQLFHGMFFDPRKYDFSRVGRMKFNIKLYDNAEYAPEGTAGNPLDRRTLDETDFIDTIKYLLKLRKGIGAVDDIDHLGNRRVRAVGELLENQFRIGLVRMERAIKEKMAVYQEMSTAMPHDLVNAKPVMAAIREFFGSSQLSQFMDQTNPLSEITHKRRLSALGPGGLSRERAGFEVRDVHPTHYGRICPIETPEGPNIGLISSLSCFARINEYGFIESPYRRVVGSQVQDDVKILNPGGTNLKVGQVLTLKEMDRIMALPETKKLPPEFEAYCDYLSAWDEDKYVIAQANMALDGEGRIVNELVNTRKAGNFSLLAREEIQYMDVSPKQLVSVAASLIPFLENDDANRALMGSNMQRQAVPLLRADSPIVGTGMEKVTARDSGAVVLCKRAGVVDSVDSERIIVRVEGNIHEGQMSREVGADIYPLTKFKRSNQNTCINQKPIVYQGQKVKKGHVLADGPCTDQGELALGRNVLVAFMPWRGCNFEDAIIVSEKLVKEDYYTSIHIEEFEIEARDTKLGPEEITRDIPNISESFLRSLDESGIIMIGSKVKPGDILVGKVTPKGETQLTPEEKLLRAIFGEKAGDVKDASLYCPPGIEGVVVDAKVFSRKGADLDERSKSILESAIEKLHRNLDDEKRILGDERAKRLAALLDGKELLADLHDEKTNKKLLSKGQPLTRDVIEKMKARDLKRMKLTNRDPRLNEAIDEIEELTSRQIMVLEKISEEKIAKLKKGDELPPGVIKMVKIYIAMKRKLSVGDKMAGRHGNKGVISRIVPEEDMPYLENGTPVEIILNPLGVPSRMNVGQILETHLGWAGRELGKKYATPVFDGATEADIKGQLTEAELPTSGKVTLYDGMTGQGFEQPVTVGIIYMLKLSHLVDDKIHARSIGPYSLITQQPLGGKAQFGGQRFGEMEVWALEAYGAAYVLQELLTAKSDDVYGRAKIYEAIVKGEAAAEPGVPESFNVLIRELQSLCLDVELMKKPKEMPDTALAAD